MNTAALIKAIERSPAPAWHRTGESKRGLLTASIALLSDDTGLFESLRHVFNRSGRTVVLVTGVGDTCRVQPAIVLVDLQMTAGAGWETADRLLEMHRCPPLMLLAAWSEQLDVRLALHAGLLVDKSLNPSELLRIVDHVLASSESSCLERKAVQRILIRWLRPFNWSVSPYSAQSVWRTNEY